MKNKIIKGLAGIAVAGTIGFVSANAYADVKKECFIRLYPPNKRYSTIEGWRTLSGANLGDIGVCAR